MSTTVRLPSTALPHRVWLVVVVSAGALVYAWLISRSWVGRDQVLLLQLGERFARTGVLDPVAKGMSGGGTIPGALLQLLVGLPLILWQDYRAPMILMGVMNLIAGLIIYRVARREFDPAACLIYFTIFWLSPWRLTHAAMLWEPAFILLPAAIHFWAVSTLAKKRNLVSSIALGIVLIASVQIHGSFLFLWILTALLIFKKQIYIHWIGLTLGLFIGGLTFIPMIIAMSNGSLPSALPTEGFIGKGFLFVAPLLKGVIYWVRLPTIDLEIKEIVYLQRGWATSPIAYVAIILLRLLQIVETLSILLGLLAAWWYIRRARRKEITWSRLSWIEQFAFCAFLSIVICAGLAPITLQSWHVIIALHAAVIPLAIWLKRFTERRRFWSYFFLYSTVGLLVAVVIGFGKPAFQKTALPREIATMPEMARLFPPGLPIEK